MTGIGRCFKSLGVVLMTLSMALGIPGCSGEATAPTASAGHGTQPASLIDLLTAPLKILAPVTGQVVESRVRIRARNGGTITAGRHTLVIPPRALSQDTTITLRDLTGLLGHVECEALPEGLVFRAPATLSSRFSDLTSPAGATMFWVVDEGTDDETWVNLGGTVTSNGVSAPLSHFSKYAPGKAGW